MTFDELIYASVSLPPERASACLDEAERLVVNQILVAGGLLDPEPSGEPISETLTSPIDEALEAAGEAFVRSFVEGGLTERVARLLGDWIDTVAQARCSQMLITHHRAALAARVHGSSSAAAV